MLLCLRNCSCRLVFVTLAACGTVPGTVVQRDAPIRLAERPAAIGTPGTIFQDASWRPMFEDRRPRRVGDILTIHISERTTAGKAAAHSNSKTGSVEFGAPTLFGLPASTAAKAALSSSSANKFEDKGATSSSNNFSGTITATVIDVLPNGNLVVSGEKQLAFDKGVEYVRLSGVVNPDTIAAGNTVPSALVADARFEYRTNSRFDKAEMMSQLARFFLSVLPF